MIAPTQREAVDAELGGGGIDEPFDIVIALRPPGAAIGADRRGVGNDDLRGHFDQRRGIDADDILDGIGRDRQRRIEEGARIAIAAQAHGEEPPAFIERQLGRSRVVAAMVVGEEALGALVGPFDRSTDGTGGVQHADIFRVDDRLHAERAADIAGEHVHLRGRDCENVVGEGVAQPEDTLAADMQRPALACAIVEADRRTRLHGTDDHAVADQLEAGDVGRPRERRRDRFGIAVMIVEHDIAGNVGVDLRSAGRHRRHGAGDRGQRVDVDRDCFGRILGLDRRFSDDDGDRLADEADPSARQGRPQRRPHRRSVAIGEGDGAFHPSVSGGVEIGGDVDRQDTRHRARRRDVDRPDDAMRVPAAHHHGIGLSREVEIVGIAPLAAQELRILHARYRLTNAEFDEAQIGGIYPVIHAHWPLFELARLIARRRDRCGGRDANTSPCHR